MNMPEQVNALENGKGIQYLLDSARNIFCSPIYVIDAFYNLIAFSGVPVDDTYWNELIETGTFGAGALELMASENVVRDVSYSDKIVRLRSDKLSSDLISGHIYNGDNIWVGQMTISEKIPFDTERIAAFEMLIDKISGEIHDYEYFTKQPTIFFQNTIEKLLDITAQSSPINNPQAQIMHFGFERYLYVAVVSIVRNDILENVHQSRLAYFQSLLKTKYQSFQYAIYTDHLVVLMSSQHSDYYSATYFSPNAGFFEENGLYIGISNSYENVYETRRYYDQALTALKNGIKQEGGQRVFYYNNGK